MLKIFSGNSRKRISLSAKLLVLFLAISTGQYLVEREVTWLTASFRWIDTTSRNVIAAPEATLERTLARIGELADSGTRALLDSFPIGGAPDTVDTPTAPADLSGRVIKVSDGDTITILDSTQTQHRIRLHGIDTPETKQAYGRAAKAAMSSLVAGKTVGVEVKDTDRYGRTVGVVHVDGTNANLEMVRRGYAWWYRQYAKSDRGLERAEAQARHERVGLWADPNPVPPWDWRRGQRVASSR
jgi:endonuclease YncB( thermonuclease family)